jgi:hypothetical protein
MGLLDQLWDETVAGPRPDSGLGKLRKYSSFSPSSSSAAAAAPGTAPPDAPAATVTRSITIVRPPSLSVPSPRGGGGEYSSSVPSSPASAPDSPFASGGGLLCFFFLSLSWILDWRVVEPPSHRCTVEL